VDVGNGNKERSIKKLANAIKEYESNQHHVSRTTSTSVIPCIGFINEELSYG
jgi:hypothetical protein